jgi:hypothetical protein
MGTEILVQGACLDWATWMNGCSRKAGEHQLACFFAMVVYVKRDLWHWYL